MWTGPAIGFAVAGFLFLVSLPGLPEHIRALAEQLGTTGAEWHWWNYLGVSIAVVLMSLSVYPPWRRLLRVRKENVAEVFDSIASLWTSDATARGSWLADLVRLATMPFAITFDFVVAFGPMTLALLWLVYVFEGLGVEQPVHAPNDQEAFTYRSGCDVAGALVNRQAFRLSGVRLRRSH